MRVLLALTFTTILSTRVSAADLSVDVEIPRLEVAEYHRPYVAIWIETADQGVVGNLAIWYDLKLKNNEGAKWLKDMRQWWRKTGRDLALPADGLSGATRPPGSHKATFPVAKTPLAMLAPGSYVLTIEAAREVGGRELLRIPFQWPLAKGFAGKAHGVHELGAVTLTALP
jgi:hypothetical protein